MQRFAITDAQLALIHASDSSLFPNALPLTQLLAWHHASPPGFFLGLGKTVLEQEVTHAQHLAGSIIALLLPKHVFQQLCAGVLAEQDITATHVGAAKHILYHGTASEKSLLGVHFWHVERSSTWWSQTSLGFSQVLQDYMKELGARHGLCRFSALTASRQGENLFTRLSFNVVGVYDIVHYNHEDNLVVTHFAKSQLGKPESDKEIYACKLMKRIL